jgi:3-oxoacyl-[acyl-carrier protein] reductase
MQTALITGVSGGIGKAIAKKFIDEGYFVIGQYNNNEKSVLEFTAELEKLGKKDFFFSVKADFTNPEQINQMMDDIQKSFKSISVLVNNSGVALYKLITDTTEQDWDKLFDVNVKSAFMITNRVLKGMISAKKGKIVNVSSMWGIVGSSMEVAYSASKSAMIGYTKALAKEVAPSGINVNCVCPGVIDTKMNARLSNEEITDIKAQTPFGRLGTAEEVADLIWFLSSDKSDFITGQIITVDGGFAL